MQKRQAHKGVFIAPREACTQSLCLATLYTYKLNGELHQELTTGEH